MLSKRWGFSLLELLVALMIISISLLGVLKLVAISGQLSQTQLWYALAQTNLLNAYEVIHSGHQQLLSQWEKELSAQLPHAKYQLTAHQITLSWRQPQSRMLHLKY